MSWWQLSPALLCAAAIVFLPGYLVLRCWAVRGLVAVGTAAPVSIGLLAVTAVFAPPLGVQWSVWPVLAAAVLLALPGLLLRKLAPAALGIRERVSRPLRSRWTLLAYLGAVLVPAVLLTRGLTRMIGHPENISQTWDNVFHLNTVRRILDTGSGSSLTVGGLSGTETQTSPYPAAWHDLVSLVVQLTDTSIPAAVNAVTLVVGALVWPISAIFLTTRVTGTRLVPVLFAGALSAAFGAFPYLILDFGVLYPYFLALALLPAAIGLLAMLAGVGARDGTPGWIAAVVLAATIPGLALAHPSTFLALLVFAVPIFVVALVRYRRVLVSRRAVAARYWLLVGLLIVYLAVALVVWSRIRPSAEASAWLPFQTMPQAMGQVLAAGFIKQGPTWVVLVLTLVAIVLVARRQIRLWVVGIYLLAASMFVIVSALPDSPFRTFVAGVWYNDSFRLAAQLPPIIVVVAAIAATWLFTSWRGALSRRFRALSWLRPASRTTPAVAAVALAGAIVLGVAGQYSSVHFAVDRGTDNYRADSEAPLLSPAERALLSRLDEHVLPGETIIANPWTGTAFAYAVGDRLTLTPRLRKTYPPEVQKLMDDLHRIGTDPRICSLIREFDSYYVLDFGGGYYMDRDEYHRGLATLASNPALELVDREGTAGSLYRINACRPRR
ncbi:DUF6541 family protein [Qaidamihabitans albus]|uniref:DUF6541 family protein n=1 Tax=Qaidamihabitans albus TaxID=2795733 RepID=UPI0018F1E651|nr:DUF6541 family protein [Qaidamihabitans albus]